MDGIKIKKRFVLLGFAAFLGLTSMNSEATAAPSKEECVLIKGIATDLLGLKTKYKPGREEMYRGLTNEMSPGPETRGVKQMYRGIIDKIYDDYTPEEIEGECNGRR